MAIEEKLLYQEITYEIRGACFWIWKEFASAFKESIIDKALTEELKKRGLKVDNQKHIDIFYNKKKVGTYIPDKVINDCVLVELKRKPFLLRQDKEQLWHYLKGSEYKLGLLINFGENELEFERIAYDTKRRSKRDQRQIRVADPRLIRVVDPRLIREQ
ncbi:MAG: GxxExxY protein [Chlamydiae bacterium]|nr:GxxExxY protein [Chlamydiota bacterium]MBI3276460.1 GxxExxY protein [Chlamydiota bacterium]